MTAMKIARTVPMSTMMTMTTTTTVMTMTTMTTTTTVTTTTITHSTAQMTVKITLNQWGESCALKGQE